MEKSHKNQAFLFAEMKIFKPASKNLGSFWRSSGYGFGRHGLPPGWHKKQFKYGGKEFIFRGLLTCAATGRVVTADTKKRVYKSGKTAEWTYLRCWKPDNPQKIMWVREEKMLEQVEDVFRQLAVPREAMESLRAHLQGTEQSERAFIKRQLAEWQKEYNLCQTRLYKLMDLLLDGGLERKAFEAKKAQIREQQISLETNMKGARAADDAFKDAFLSMLNLAAESHDLFAGSTVAQKRQLINFVFANLQMDGENLRFSLKKPFDRMLNLTNCHEWLGWQDSNLRMPIPKTGALPLGHTPMNEPIRAENYITRL